jgi:hypothetical protein
MTPITRFLNVVADRDQVILLIMHKMIVVIQPLILDPDE